MFIANNALLRTSESFEAAMAPSSPILSALLYETLQNKRP